MTVTTTENFTTYVGDGIETVFSFSFQVQEASDIICYIDGSEVFNFTTLINADQDGNPGGTVTFDAPPADQANITIYREVPETQLTDYTEYDPFPAESHEDALDKLTMINQQLQEQLSRVNLPPPGTVPDGDAIVQGDLTVEGNSTFQGTATGNQAPTLDEHLTRKDYVDNLVAAAISANNLAVYPIGSRKIGPDPTSAIGGTWTQMAEGTFLMNTIAGADPSGGSNDAVVVTHTHTITDRATSTSNSDFGTYNSGNAVVNQKTSGATGVDGTDLNKPLYVGVEVWERTA